MLVHPGRDIIGVARGCSECWCTPGREVTNGLTFEGKLYVYPLRVQKGKFLRIFYWAGSVMEGAGG